MPTRFDHASLAALDEPVRRYLAHAIDDGAPLHAGMRLTMSGHIRVGPWLSFAADQEFRDHDFTWRARAGVGPFRPLHVVDRYSAGRGGTEGRVLGRFRFLRADDHDSARSAAGRAAAESIWTPASLLPDRGVRWRAEDPNTIVATVDVPPERPDVELQIDGAGALRGLELMRWGDVGRSGFGYTPFGGVVHEERRFGDLVLPSRIAVGWWFDTPRYAPFFEATVLTARPLEPRAALAAPARPA